MNILKLDPEQINTWLVNQHTQACSGYVLVLISALITVPTLFGSTLYHLFFILQ